MLKVSMIMATVAGLTGAAVASQISEIDDRLFEVEEKLGGKYPSTSIDAKKSRFGGALKVTYNGVKSKEVTSNNSAVQTTDELGYDSYHNSFSTRLDLTFAGDITDNMEYLFVPSSWHSTNGENMDSAGRTFDDDRWTETVIYRMWGMYKTSAGNFKFGRMLTPFGTYVNTYSPISERVPVFPQSLLGGGSHGTFHDFVIDGIQYDNTWRMGGSKLKLQLWTGVNAPYSEEIFAGGALKGNSDELLAGGRVGFSTLGDSIDLGVSAYHGRRESSFTNIAFDTTMRFGKLGLKGEFIMSKENQVQSPGCTSIQAEDLTHRAIALAGAGSLVESQVKSQMVSAGIGSENANYECYSAILDTWRAADAITNAQTTGAGQTTAALAIFQEAATQVLTHAKVSDKKQFYIEPTYQITDKLMFALRYDWTDMDSETFYHGGTRSLYAGTLHFKPNPLVNFQLSAIYRDYEANEAKNSVLRDIEALADGSKTNTSGLNTIAALGTTYSTVLTGLLATEDGNKLISEANANPDYMEYRFDVVFSF